MDRVSMTNSTSLSNTFDDHFSKWEAVFKYNCHIIRAEPGNHVIYFRSTAIVRLLPLSSFSVSVSSLEIKQFMSFILTALSLYLFTELLLEDKKQCPYVRWNDCRTTLIQTHDSFLSVSPGNTLYRVLYLIEFVWSLSFLTTLLFTKILHLKRNHIFLKIWKTRP